MMSSRIALRLIISTLWLLASIAAVKSEPPKVPSSVTMKNGEVMYVTGNDYSKYSVTSGDWNCGKTWDDGTVPTKDDRVLITHDVTTVSDCHCQTIVVVRGGTLRPEDGTRLHFGTVTTLMGSRFIGGSPEEPLTDCLFLHTSHPYDEGDTGKSGNGLILAGETKLYGKPTTTWAAPDEPTPMEWVNQQVIESHGYRASLTRPIRFVRESGEIGPHFMQMHNPNCEIQYVELVGYGRTRKSAPVHSETNPIGKYSGIHYHRCGEEKEIRETGVSIHDFDGWGDVNHASNVDRSWGVIANGTGAAIVNEAGIEVGHTHHYLVMNIDGIHSIARRNILANGTRGHMGSGDGYWSRSPREKLSDSVFINCPIGVFNYHNGMYERIAGVRKRAVYADGMPPSRVNPEPIERVTVIAPKIIGINDHRGKARTYRHVKILEANGKYGTESSYNEGCNWFDSTISGTAPVGFRWINMPSGSIARFRDTDITGFAKGSVGKFTALQRMEFQGGTVKATEVGLEERPSRFPAADNTTVVTGTWIEAPETIRLVPATDDPDYHRRASAPAGYRQATNRVVVDGIDIAEDWPGITEE